LSYASITLSLYLNYLKKQHFFLNNLQLVTTMLQLCNFIDLFFYPSPIF